MADTESGVGIPAEAIQVLRDLNPWWAIGHLRKPAPPYRRRGVDGLITRMARRSGLIEIIRGPRQVGKTTAIEQIVEHLLRSKAAPTDILFVRFDQEVLRKSAGGLLPIIRWYTQAVRRRPFEKGSPAYVFLDEVHKLERWDEDVKHLWDTFPMRLMLTGSSSVLVARGGRESLAGRVITTEMPTFQFREVLEAWAPIAQRLPPSHNFEEILDPDIQTAFDDLRGLRPQQRHSIRRHLERYYNRGGYPRLYNGEVQDDVWAEYLTETIFGRVLGIDVPDLFPIRNPQLLRWLYVEVARSTGQEIAQARLAEWANAAGFTTSQPHVGNYLHYLADALLIREFRRYPLAKRASSRTPAKITLTDLGARNAVFRGAPSLWESSPDHIGPLIETLAQSVIRGHDLQVHFFRDYENPRDRRTPTREVDFVVEHTNGSVIPIEIKFRRHVHDRDLAGLRTFLKRFKNAPHGIMVTRETYAPMSNERIMLVPLMEFLLAF
jgi:uncharacterized protein